MTGLRIDTAVSGIRRKLDKLKHSCSANEFRPEVERFASRSLATCIETTPVRNEALIAANQIKQYNHRVNYIPSYHTVTDPTLIVKAEGEFLFCGGKWYRPGLWNLKSEVYAAYEMLSAERARRMQTAQSDFVNERKQARFLYQRSWWQVAQSLGIAFAVSAAIVNSRNRRKPSKEPPKAFGQWRGGGTVLSVVIRNVFLDLKTKYWNGNGKSILAQSIAKHRARFHKECNDKVKRMISAARQTA